MSEGRPTLSTMTEQNDGQDRPPLTPMEKIAAVGVAAPLLQQAADAATALFSRGEQRPPSTETRQR